MTQPPVITVDGASGSGKSTLGRRLAVALDLPLVDTGLVYRGVMVAAVRDGVEADNTARIIELAKSVELEINTDPAGGEWTLRVDGVDAGTVTRDPRYSILLSSISRIPQVRDALLPTQRNLGKNGCVAVGRDCGTVVFPGATVKFYLQAPSDVRVLRRDAQLRQSGLVTTGSTSASSVDIRERDRLDAASLRPASNVKYIDTGSMDADAAFDVAVTLCREAGLPA